ncbi:MAG: SAM-dependent methyltransferase [Microvirga sp.]|jgi:protein-L-isoaspartate(D-aspartate) O-methyltransferase|nr:SAM-dependent methyltransferase [Microvirga sp.]
MSKTGLERVRRDYAQSILRLAGVTDPRIEEVFATTPREAFLRGPPWTLIRAGFAWSSSDPADLYDDVLVAIDRARGINNGEPALHAAWLAAVDPQPGETVIHVGAGTGYYTAMLARLVDPGGRVYAYEYEPDLAAEAARNLGPDSNVEVRAESAYGRPLPQADIIYVNAGVTAPDDFWLRALKLQGRLLFPWQPHGGWGPALLVTRLAGGYAAQPLMSVGFIGCSGTMPIEHGHPAPSGSGPPAPKAIWLRSDREPDSTAIAVYDEVWFSSDGIA